MRKLTLNEYLLFTEAWLSIAVARVLLLTTPFKKITPLLGKQVEHQASRFDALSLRYKALSIAIERAARRSPWRAMCFEQAIAAKFMLRRRKQISTVYFGVKKTSGEKKMLAHAWVVCENQAITGGKNCDDFLIVNCYKN